MMQYAQCSLCRNLKDIWKCTAFPVSIPQQIIDNNVDHRIEYPGDNNVLFDPVDEDAKKQMDENFGELEQQGG